MSKIIYPGNWVVPLSSYQAQGVTSIPGANYFHRVGYARVTSTGANSFPITIPSPDLRGDDKPRADIVGLKVPNGAYLYRIGLRVQDVRKDLGVGTASSGLVGTNGDRIKVATAVTVAPGTLNSATTAAGAALTVASTTIAPGQAVSQVITPQLTSQELTLSLVVDNGVNAAGSNLTSTATGGTYIICEVCYFMFDDVPAAESVPKPFLAETL